MTLRYIKVRDFQAHESFTLRLDPRVTVVVGENDAGKSSLIRAAFWACFNQPVGDWMLRHGAKEVVATLCFDDVKVSRRKGGKNSYSMDGKKYVSFGAGKVPDAIAHALNVSEVNFQRHGDGAFWLSDSPGEVSRRLNAIVDLSVIDESLSNAQSFCREAKAKKEVCQSRLEKAKLQKLAFAWVPEMMEQLRMLKRAEAKAIASREKSLRISTIIEKARTLTRQRRYALEATQGASALVLLGDRIFERRGRIEKLRSLLNKIAATELARVEVPDYARLDELTTSIRARAKRIESLRHTLARIKTEEACLRQAERSSTRVREEIRDKTEGLCPLCGAEANLSSSP